MWQHTPPGKESVIERVSAEIGDPAKNTIHISKFKKARLI